MISNLFFFVKATIYFENNNNKRYANVLFFCQKYIIITFWNDHFTKRLIERREKRLYVLFFLVVDDFVGSLSISI